MTRINDGERVSLNLSFEKESTAFKQKYYDNEKKIILEKYAVKIYLYMYIQRRQFDISEDIAG